jgi:hypothetical protein
VSEIFAALGFHTRTLDNEPPAYPCLETSPDLGLALEKWPESLRIRDAMIKRFSKE